MNQPSWTLAEATERCGVSRSTLKRRLAAEELPNAYKTPKGEWRIPVSDLISAGYRPGAPDWGSAQLANSEIQNLDLERAAELERELVLERARRVAAEQIAEERRGRIEDLQLAMRLLEAPRAMDSSSQSTARSSDPVREPSEGSSDPVHYASEQVSANSREPSPRPTDPDRDGSATAVRQRRWWQRPWKTERR